MFATDLTTRSLAMVIQSPSCPAVAILGLVMSQIRLAIRIDESLYIAFSTSDMRSCWSPIQRSIGHGLDAGSKERSRRSASLISWVGDDFEWALDIDSADESGSAAIPEFAQAALDHVGVPGMT